MNTQEIDMQIPNIGTPDISQAMNTNYKVNQ